MSHSTRRRTVDSPPPHSHTHIHTGSTLQRMETIPLHTQRTAYHFPATAHAVITSYTPLPLKHAHTHRRYLLAIAQHRRRPHTTPHTYYTCPRARRPTPSANAHFYTPATYRLACTNTPTHAWRGSPSSHHTSQHVRAGPWTSPSQPRRNPRQHSPSSTPRHRPIPTNTYTHTPCTHAHTMHTQTTIGTVMTDNNHMPCLTAHAVGPSTNPTTLSHTHPRKQHSATHGNNTTAHTTHRLPLPRYCARRHHLIHYPPSHTRTHTPAATSSPSRNNAAPKAPLP
jgi:hypothetical protein